MKELGQAIEVILAQPKFAQQLVSKQGGEEGAGLLHQ
jgi:hypothetical protein